jgi:hypothetical protein
LADAMKHGMGARSVQGVLGVTSQSSGVGAQGLGQAGFAFDRGPCRKERVGGGKYEERPPVAGQGVAHGALDDLVHAYGLVGNAGGVVDQIQAVQGPQCLVGLDEL